MHLKHDRDIASVSHSKRAQSAFQTLEQHSSDAPSAAEKRGLEYVRTFPFAPDARVSGYLLKADIGPVSFGYLHGADSHAEHSFVRFEAIGIDSRGGYDIVRSAAGVGYVIVTYAPHARKCGLNHLKDHIGANPDHYAARALIIDSPWPHTQDMINQLEAGWKRRLAPHRAQQRLETLHSALAEIKLA